MRMNRGKFVCVLKAKHFLLWGETTQLLKFGKGSSEYTGTWHYLCYDRDSVLSMACTEDVHCLKNLIEEGSCNLGLHTCWAKTVFGTLRQSTITSWEFIT